MRIHFQSRADSAVLATAARAVIHSALVAVELFALLAGRVLVSFRTGIICGLVGRIAVICFVVAFALMFVGGSRILGSFDPWDSNATVLSVTLGVIYCAASVVFWVALASYFSRFRPRTREAKDTIRDARVLELEHEIKELRKQIEETPKQE